MYSALQIHVLPNGLPITCGAKRRQVDLLPIYQCAHQAPGDTEAAPDDHSRMGYRFGVIREYQSEDRR
jgi:hypothetical protein